MAREGGILMVSALPALESEGAVQMVWWSQEETLFADDIMMEGLSATSTSAAAGTFIRCVNEHYGMRASVGRAGKSRGMAYGVVDEDEIVLGDLWLDHQDGQTLSEAEVIAEDKFLVEKAEGIWMGEPDRTVKRTSKAVYLGTRCTQDGGFSVELAHRLNQGNRAWIRHRA